MALSEDIKNKLYLHLQGQDTMKQKIEFRKLLLENKELEHIYYQLRTEDNTYSAENFKAYLIRNIDEANAFDESVIEEVVTSEIKPIQPNWYEKLMSQLKAILDNIPLPGFLAGLPQPQLIPLALLVLVVVGVGWGVNSWQLDRYQNSLLENYGNAYGPTQGESTPDACGNELKNQHYILADNENIAKQNITNLNKQNVSETCRSYYLGRSYMSLNDYENAIQSFIKAQASKDPKIQEMATYDLALSYLLKGDKQKGLEVLSSRSTWSEKKVIDALKKRVE